MCWLRVISKQLVEETMLLMKEQNQERFPSAEYEVSAHPPTLPVGKER